MIKASQIDVDAVVAFIKTCNILPNWLEMQIPHGCTLSQCIQATISLGIETQPHLLLSLQTQQQQQQQQQQQHAHQQPRQVHSPAQLLPGKRKTSNDLNDPVPKRLAMATAEPHSATPPRGINIQPRLPTNTFAPITPRSSAFTSPATRNPPKKRGRPSRADKDALARASGSMGQPAPYLALASKPAQVIEPAAPASFDSAARTSVIERDVSQAYSSNKESIREKTIRPATFRGSPSSERDSKTTSEDVHLTHLKDEPPPSTTRPPDTPSEHFDSPKAGATLDPNPSLSSRVAIAELVKTESSTTVTTRT
ncbi:hypothetical protein SPI_09048 [Niveomyces insectorum RCEF 264]|uniref:Uncharacterized protein n=1 Tax=Niveomyces insectorum RCEF 264 TaxID=1081102 RepID=A0A167M9W6_9HYPO|nr:hypothetical protein SPI_09048 [Niveomyces insectorum RCEF 264]